MGRYGMSTEQVVISRDKYDSMLLELHKLRERLDKENADKIYISTRSPYGEYTSMHLTKDVVAKLDQEMLATISKLEQEKGFLSKWSRMLNFLRGN